MAAMVTTAPRLGELLRTWRARRRMSQLDLATSAQVSPRHLSFVETGRAKPSREMVLHLAEHLDVPLRDRNELLTAAGFAPLYRQSGLDDPALASVRAAIEVILANHAPFPAFVIDGGWQLLDANEGVAAFLPLIGEALTQPPMNVIRASLHPDGLSRRIVNFAEYAAHVVERLRRQLASTNDSALAALLEEVTAYPAVAAALAEADASAPLAAVLPLHFRLEDGTELRFFSTMTVFGSPLDVTIAELAIESFFPADEATRAVFAG
jgi:transcriptional regulator with XRE-family HTH domain